MTDGPERARLRSYLSGARVEATDAAGTNWRSCGQILEETAAALRMGALRVRDGDGTQGGLSGVTAEAVLAAFQASAESMQEKGTRLVTAGDTLRDTSQVMSQAQAAEAGMADLNEPPAYTAPTRAPGYTPTPEDIQAEADKRQAAQQERAAYDTARAQQEAAAAQWTQKLDAAFLGAIPPMKAIHGQPDPTEPPPTVPSSPSGPGLPPTGPRTPATPGTPDPTTPNTPDWGEPTRPDRGEPTKPDRGDPVDQPDPVRPDPVRPEPLSPDPSAPDPITTPAHPTHHVPGGTTTVAGSAQSGITYDPSAAQASAGSSTGGPANGTNAAALGAAGAAGGASGMVGGIRAGSAPAPAGSSPARPIGATGRSGSAGALSRSASAPGSSPARAAGSPAARGASGSPAARSAGSAGARSAGSAGGRGAGSAGGRGAGSGSASRSQGRGASGARGAAAGANGRGGRTGDRDEAAERDSLVYQQDWLGDDDVAPGVLD